MEVFVGQIILWASNFELMGWLFCNGQILEVADYPDLFAVIGKKYGGDGKKTFAVPNLQGHNFGNKKADENLKYIIRHDKDNICKGMNGYGQMALYAGDKPPANWQFCQGQKLNIAENADFFYLIGTLFGGDGVKNFALPNIQNKGTLAGLNYMICTRGTLNPFQSGNDVMCLIVLMAEYTPRVRDIKEWLSCDGQILRIDMNSAIFSMLGTTYGGDGSKTFALPNLNENGNKESMRYYICKQGIYPTRY